MSRSVPGPEPGDAPSDDRKSELRHLVLVLGDQLSLANPALTDFDRSQDRVLMIESAAEARHVWSHKARIALFLAAMRQFAELLARQRFPLVYVRLDDPDANGEELAAILAARVRRHRPAAVVVTEPGEYRVLAALQDACRAVGVALDVRADTHFMVSRAGFARWAGNTRHLRMEFFYRDLRRKTGILMDGAKPEGGAWNYDSRNRAAFGKSGPGRLPAPPTFAPDALTREVLALVATRFPDHPGTLAHFGWPLTREQALTALRSFVDERLGRFGPHQDAMWTQTPFAWHSTLSSSLNLKLLNPREVIDAALAVYRERRLPLASVEGFVRQVMGWREFIRGVYWLDMPALADANFFQHQRALPSWYWTGETHMRCMRKVIGQTLRYGYAHHIQRLMVTGNFALLAELDPRRVCDWYLAVYVDAVEWVELPNTAGMALHAAGPRFTSKPYAASGAYIRRMSNYCEGCRYAPEARSGPSACPLTVLYWKFLDRHEASLAASPRTSLMVRNLARLTGAERSAIRARAGDMLADLDRL